MKRGGIVRVNLEDGQPPEFGKSRPAVVVSNEEANAVLPTVVVVPLSTRPPEIWPLRLAVPPVAGLRNSHAVIPGIRQISKSRITGTLGEAPGTFLKSLQEAISAYLSD
jgi:mRNA interferase MazF